MPKKRETGVVFFCFLKLWNMLCFFLFGKERFGVWCCWVFVHLQGDEDETGGIFFGDDFWKIFCLFDLWSNEMLLWCHLKSSWATFGHTSPTPKAEGDLGMYVYVYIYIYNICFLWIFLQMNHIKWSWMIFSLQLMFQPKMMIYHDTSWYGKQKVTTTKTLFQARAEGWPALRRWLSVCTQWRYPCCPRVSKRSSLGILQRRVTMVMMKKRNNF